MHFSLLAELKATMASPASQDEPAVRARPSRLASSETSQGSPRVQLSRSIAMTLAARSTAPTFWFSVEFGSFAAVSTAVLT